jgi:hypothetical protein
VTGEQLPGQQERCEICKTALAVRYVTAECDDIDLTTSRWCCLEHLHTAVETVGLDGKRAIKVTRICRPDPRRPR